MVAKALALVVGLAGTSAFNLPSGPQTSRRDALTNVGGFAAALALTTPLRANAQNAVPNIFTVSARRREPIPRGRQPC